MMKERKRVSFKNKTQLVLVAFLLTFIIYPLGMVNAADVLLQGQLTPAEIVISLDKGAVDLDIAAGSTSKSDSITVTSTSLIPVEMTLASFTQDVDSWKPTLITTDPTELGLTDAQSKARMKISLTSDDIDYAAAPAFDGVSPTGTGSTVSTYIDGTYSASDYSVDLGTIKDTDGVTGKSVVIGTTLDVSSKRMLSKGFDATMVINFAVDTSIGG